MGEFEVVKPIFMIGMPRSGTSLIAETIDKHEDLGWFSNYLNHFPSLPSLSFLNRTSDIPFWGKFLIGKKKQNKGMVPSIRKFLPHSSEAYSVWSKLCGNKILRNYLLEQKASRIERENTLKYIKTVLKLHKKKRFFAKFTGPPRICYLNSLFPDAYFIHLIRDPRAVTASLLNISFWKLGGGLVEPWWENGFPDDYLREWESYEKSPVALAALQWKRIVDLTWQEKSLLPEDRVIEIKYEQYVENPLKALEKIFLTIGLGKSPAVNRYLLTSGKVSDMNYKYKSFLTIDQVKLIEKITCETAKLGGYIFDY